MKRQIVFVFGSNLAGRHGKGAALDAKKHWGAEYGVGIGPSGDSYAIPTKNEKLEVLSLISIKEHIKTFLKYVKEHEDTLFYVTAFGTGLAGYRVEQIKSLFGDLNKLPYNICFTKDWFVQD